MGGRARCLIQALVLIQTLKRKAYPLDPSKGQPPQLICSARHRLATQRDWEDIAPTLRQESIPGSLPETSHATLMD